jgi:hypothetical protein
MTADQIFPIANQVALVGWLLLILFPRKKWSAPLVTGAVLPLLLAVLYAGLIATFWGRSNGGFNSLAGVSSLFANRWMLLAGWVHYLAFDLFIGNWQVRDSQRQDIPYIAVVPCLLLTFFFGPVGLLLYYSIRFARRRSLVTEV